MNTNPLINTRLTEPYLLLTGATGLVGSYLMRDLILHGRKLAVVARSCKRISAVERVEAIMQRWEYELGRNLPRPIVLEGDIAEPGFGLCDSAMQWIQSHVSEIIHNAAILKFSGADMNQEPWRTNLGGTKHAIELARIAGIRHFNYVSTAYVCGLRSETIYEDELECGQSFRNDYEHSKFRSELLVHAAEGFDTKTIFRPAVIVGDSTTGYTSTYHGLFMYLRLLATLVPQQERDENGKLVTPIKLPMTGDEPRNLVPVDWVSQVISHVVCTPAAKNRTYHLAPDRCTTARQILNACYKYFNSRGVEFCGKHHDREADSEFARRFFENARIYEAYETSDPRFDVRNLKRFAGHLDCPSVDEEMIVRFMEFGQADNWGKRRAKRPTVTRWFANQLEDIVRGVELLDVRQHLSKDQTILRIGLDIHGPGGGQWQVTAEHDACEITRGLPREPHRLLCMDQDEVDNLVNNGHDCTATAWAMRLSSMLLDE